MTKPQSELDELIEEAFASIGVSGWREIGKKYGYWDYFKSEQKKEFKAQILKGIIEWWKLEKDLKIPQLEIEVLEKIIFDKLKNL